MPTFNPHLPCSRVAPNDAAASSALSTSPYRSKKLSQMSVSSKSLPQFGQYPCSFVCIFPSNRSDRIFDNHLIIPCFTKHRFVFTVLCDCFFKSHFANRYNVLTNMFLCKLFCFFADCCIGRILFWCGWKRPCAIFKDHLFANAIRHFYYIPHTKH